MRGQWVDGPEMKTQREFSLRYRYRFMSGRQVKFNIVLSSLAAQLFRGKQHLRQAIGLASGGQGSRERYAY